MPRTSLGPASATLFLVPLALLAAGCSTDSDATWVDPSPHAGGFVEVNGVQLNYMDWGGTGEPLVLVHGRGGTPHIFDGIAPHFTDHFHVVSYARRGHGKSESQPPFDNDTLTEDLRQFIDELGFQRVNLVGFSMGGNEITHFAMLYPERVHRLVYLDAAYDWTDPLSKELLDTWPSSDPTVDDRRSADALKNWVYRRGWGRNLPPGDVVDAIFWDLVEQHEDGLFYFAPDDIQAELGESLTGYQHDYTKIGAPALAIYAVWYVDGVAGPNGTEVERAKATEWIEETVRPWQDQNHNRFRDTMANGKVIVLEETDHALHIQKPDTVVREMRAFLVEGG